MLRSKVETIRAEKNDLILRVENMNTRPGLEAKISFSPRGRNKELDSANKEIDFLNKQVIDLRE